jgi:hypothetical protein
MLNLPLNLVIEGLVAVLLVITIIYCILLNSRLKRLRADEEGLRATIAELLTATEIAERAIQGLRSTSAQCDQTLGQRLNEADRVSNELASRLTAASAVVERIGQLAIAGRGMGEGQGAHPRAVREAAPATPTPSPSRQLDDAARALQSRLQRAAS